MEKQNLVLSSIEPNAIFWFAVIAMSLFFVASLTAVTFLLKRCPAWSIGDALSEEADPQAPVAPGQKPILLASASRTIALFGLLVMMGALVGVAYFVLWALFYGQPLDNLTKLSPVFYGAASLFAPYAVNQVRSAVVGLGAAGKAAVVQQGAKAVG
jgi:hypothetical protein